MKCILPKEISPRLALFFSAAFLQTLFGGFTLFFHNDIFHKLLESQLVVREGTQAYDAWKETPIPVYTKYYLFSILNPQQFINDHAKPILEEKGPYVFREKEEKVDMVWHANHTVSYRRKKMYWFEPEMSAGPLTDTVVTLNLPLVAAADMARDDFMMQWGLTDIFSTMQAELFLTKTVGEILFDGYTDELVTIADSFKEEEEEKGRNSVPMDKFGWFYKRNGTTWSDGDLSMHTGEDDISLLGKISTWNYATSTSAFPGECGRVRGSSDGLFAPGTLAMRDNFEIWSTDICRTIQFQRSGLESIHGIPADKFQLSAEVFANETQCSANGCYNNNLPTGVQNVTQCKLNSPAFVSRPHFYAADPSYVDQFQYGISPDPAKHESYFLIEPKTSIPLKVSMRLQLNILISANPGISYLFEDLPRVFYPVLWFESEAILTETMAGQLSLLINLPTIMVVCGGVGVILGCLSMLMSMYCTLRRNTKRKGDTAVYAKVNIGEPVFVSAEAVKPIIKSSTRLISAPEL